MPGNIVHLKTGSKLSDKFFNTTVGIAHFVGYDVNGRPIVGDLVPYDARVQHKLQLTRASDGTEQVSMATVYVKGAPIVSPDDQITLPDGSHPAILSAMTYPEDIGFMTMILLKGTA